MEKSREVIPDVLFVSFCVAFRRKTEPSTLLHNNASSSVSNENSFGRFVHKDYKIGYVCKQKKGNPYVKTTTCCEFDSHSRSERLNCSIELRLVWY